MKHLLHYLMDCDSPYNFTYNDYEKDPWMDGIDGYGGKWSTSLALVEDYFSESPSDSVASMYCLATEHVTPACRQIEQQAALRNHSPVTLLVNLKILRKVENSPDQHHTDHDTKITSWLSNSILAAVNSEVDVTSNVSAKPAVEYRCSVTSDLSQVKSDRTATLAASAETQQSDIMSSYIQNVQRLETLTTNIPASLNMCMNDGAFPQRPHLDESEGSNILEVSEFPKLQSSNAADTAVFEEVVGSQEPSAGDRLQVLGVEHAPASWTVLEDTTSGDLSTPVHERQVLQLDVPQVAVNRPLLHDTLFTQQSSQNFRLRSERESVEDAYNDNHISDFPADTVHGNPVLTVYDEHHLPFPASDLSRDVPSTAEGNKLIEPSGVSTADLCMASNGGLTASTLRPLLNASTRPLAWCAHSTISEAEKTAKSSSAAMAVEARQQQLGVANVTLPHTIGAKLITSTTGNVRLRQNRGAMLDIDTSMTAHGNLNAGFVAPLETPKVMEELSFHERAFKLSNSVQACAQNGSQMVEIPALYRLRDASPRKNTVPVSLSKITNANPNITPNGGGRPREDGSIKVSPYAYPKDRKAPGRHTHGTKDFSQSLEEGWMWGTSGNKRKSSDEPVEQLNDFEQVAAASASISFIESPVLPKSTEITTPTRLRSLETSPASFNTSRSERKTQEYSLLSKLELIALLKTRGMPSSGNKPDLIKRLEEDDKKQTTESVHHRKRCSKATSPRLEDLSNPMLPQDYQRSSVGPPNRELHIVHEDDENSIVVSDTPSPTPTAPPKKKLKIAAVIQKASEIAVATETQIAKGYSGLVVKNSATTTNHGPLHMDDFNDTSDHSPGTGEELSKTLPSREISAATASSTPGQAKAPSLFGDGNHPAITADGSFGSSNPLTEFSLTGMNPPAPERGRRTGRGRRGRTARAVGLGPRGGVRRGRKDDEAKPVSAAVAANRGNSRAVKASRAGSRARGGKHV